ncbi:MULTISPECIES: hypothetical protein [unclassified Enterococcus]|uniref:hypothetical protein n=1 Tax=unclassified Enterococcus TaxID=2608891 RepID=UPI00035305B0|nr:hypothetical protein D922_02440 [Enterococcus faecalis 06-MB-DW-09]OTO90151.1 hypothetical protein A5852_003492 [Enterococcus faecium]
MTQFKKLVMLIIFGILFFGAAGTCFYLYQTGAEPKTMLIITIALAVPVGIAMMISKRKKRY